MPPSVSFGLHLRLAFPAFLAHIALVSTSRPGNADLVLRLLAQHVLYFSYVIALHPLLAMFAAWGT